MEDPGMGKWGGRSLPIIRFGKVKDNGYKVISIIAYVKKTTGENYYRSTAIMIT